MTAPLPQFAVSFSPSHPPRVSANLALGARVPSVGPAVSLWLTNPPCVPCQSGLFSRGWRARAPQRGGDALIGPRTGPKVPPKFLPAGKAIESSSLKGALCPEPRIARSAPPVPLPAGRAGRGAPEIKQSDTCCSCLREKQ